MWNGAKSIGFWAKISCSRSHSADATGTEKGALISGITNDWIKPKCPDYTQCPAESPNFMGSIVTKNHTQEQSDYKEEESKG